MAQPAWVVRVRRARSYRHSRSGKFSDHSRRIVSSVNREYVKLDWWAYILAVFIPHTRTADQAALRARAVLRSDGLPASAPAATRLSWWRSAIRQVELRRLPLRLASHIVTLLLVLLVVAGGARLSIEPRQSAPAAPIASADQKDRSVDLQILRSIAPTKQSDAAGIDLPANRVSDLQTLPAFVEVHTLAEGETLGQVADQFHTSIAALFWANDLGTGNIFAAGQDLRIPRIDGVPHIIQDGETLESIAEQFQVRPQAIELFKANNVHAAQPLPVGREIFIPGGKLPFSDELLAKFGGEQGLRDLRAVAAATVRESETNIRTGPGRDYPTLGTLEAGRRLKLLARHDEWVKVDNGVDQQGWVRADLLGLSDETIAKLTQTNDFAPPPMRWIWPTRGEITSPFGWRSKPFRSFHDGLDIANAAWTKIYAARTGYVIESGWCSGFGYCVKLDHGDGVTTIYGHMIKRPPVKVGAKVEAGELIGYMGSTFDRSGGGYSTGVHLHFTVKVNGKAVNPLNFLP